MASHAPNPPAPAESATPFEPHFPQPSVWKFSNPARWVVDYEEVVTDIVTMRPIAPRDLAVFDEHQGKPIALVQHLVAKLCDVPVGYVKDLPLRDFLLLAEEAQYLAIQCLPRLGLKPDDYFKPRNR